MFSIIQHYVSLPYITVVFIDHDENSKFTFLKIDTSHCIVYL